MAAVEELLAEAEAARDAGDYARVRALTEEISSRGEDTPEELLERARSLHQSVGGDRLSQVIAAICIVILSAIFIYYALLH